MMSMWVSGAVVLFAAYFLRKPLLRFLLAGAGLARRSKDTQQQEEKTLLTPTSSNRAKDVIAKFEQQALINTNKLKKQQGYSFTGTKKKTTRKAALDSNSSTADAVPKEPIQDNKSSNWFRVVWSHFLSSQKEELSKLGSSCSKQFPTEEKQQVLIVGRCPVCRRKLMKDDVVTFQQLSIHKECFVCRGCGDDLGQKEKEGQNYACMTATNGKVKFTCATCRTMPLKPTDSFASIAGERTVIGESEYGNVDKVVGEIGDDLEQAVYFMTPRCATCGGDLNQTYKKESVKVIGRTVYHPHCFEEGRPHPDLTKPCVKLPPSFCAKYLPPQIILKLSTDKETLTTLYFCWKNRVEHAMKLRKEDARVVVVPFVLDGDAPANPNHQPSNTKRKQPKIHMAQPHFSTVKVELVSGVQVGPRKPIMPKPAWIDSLSFHAHLTYLHFGLEYYLELTIPLKTDAMLHLTNATLSVTIQDWQ